MRSLIKDDAFDRVETSTFKSMRLIGVRELRRSMSKDYIIQR